MLGIKGRCFCRGLNSVCVIFIVLLCLSAVHPSASDTPLKDHETKADVNIMDKFAETYSRPTEYGSTKTFLAIFVFGGIILCLVGVLAVAGYFFVLSGMDEDEEDEKSGKGKHKKGKGKKDDLESGMDKDGAGTSTTDGKTDDGKKDKTKDTEDKSEATAEEIGAPGKKKKADGGTESVETAEEEEGENKKKKGSEKDADSKNQKKGAEGSAATGGFGGSKAAAGPADKSEADIYG